MEDAVTFTKNEVRDQVINGLLNWKAYESASGEGEIEELGIERLFGDTNWRIGHRAGASFELFAGGRRFVILITLPREPVG